MVKKNVFVIVLLLLVCGPVYPKDFTYKGEDCEIRFRFSPNNGTLNDLTVIYNGNFIFYPANFGGITKFKLAGKELHPWQDKHKAILLDEKDSGEKYEATFRWSYKGQSFDFTIKMQLNEKTLSIEFTTAPGNEKVVEFGFDRSEQTLAPKIIYLPYGHNVLFFRGIFVSAIIDHRVSNASAVVPLEEYYSNTSAYFGHEAHYHTLTDGSRNNLKETMYLTVSPDIRETFFQVDNPVSPYRDFLVDKVIVDLWSERFDHYRDGLKILADGGMTGLFALMHVWQKNGYDNGLPTTFPAGDSYGGENALLEVIDLCEANEYLFALHTNYVDFYENSDVWDSRDVAINSDGTLVKAWYNSSTGKQSYLMKPSKAVSYAGLYEPLIHKTYRSNASFLDVHSSILPTYKVDYDAAVSNAGKQAATFNHYRDLIAYARNTHSGPVAGEGFGSSTNIWAGYVDAIEADPRSSHNRGGTDIPLIADYKLYELHHLFVPHGAGYLERFFLDKWKNYTLNELERYRITQIAFGNAGFIHNPFPKKIPLEEVLKDYCFLKHLQRYYLKEIPEEIRYYVENQLLNLSQALQKILPATPRQNVYTALNEELSLLKVTYSGGFILYINRSKSKSWDVAKDDVLYRLPPNGFLAYKGSEFLAYTALIKGEKRYYIYPKESICCPVISPVFLNVRGRKVENRSLLQVEYIHHLTWEIAEFHTKDITKYRIYRIEDGNWSLLTECDADTFEYRHRFVEKERQTTYALVTVDDKNREDEPVYIIIE
ncbi:DUF5696 domain-containing protein [Acidobacteriota bacterium]